MFRIRDGQGRAELAALRREVKRPRERQYRHADLEAVLDCRNGELYLIEADRPVRVVQDEARIPRRVPGRRRDCEEERVRGDAAPAPVCPARAGFVPVNWPGTIRSWLRTASKEP